MFISVGCITWKTNAGLLFLFNTKVVHILNVTEFSSSLAYGTGTTRCQWTGHCKNTGIKWVTGVSRSRLVPPLGTGPPAGGENFQQQKLL